MTMIFYFNNINFFVAVMFQFIYLGQRMALAIEDTNGLEKWNRLKIICLCLQLIYVMAIPIINDDICFWLLVVLDGYSSW